MITNRPEQFYASLGAQHDDVYDEEERQEDLEELREFVAFALKGHRVLELACGAGYWTEVIAETAEHVVAIDINPNLVELARERDLPEESVTLRVADAWQLPDDLGAVTAVFIGFWWSHVAREEQERFLKLLRAKLGKDVLLVVADDDYVDGISEPIARTDAAGNTYQVRQAPDGEYYEILKTYPSDSALRKKLASTVREIKIERWELYFLLTCRLK